MLHSSDVDISFRSENEISVSAVQILYRKREHIFDVALNAVIAGCVTEYSFDNVERKFVGIVDSFERDQSYKLQIFVTNNFMIQSASCECLDTFCYHIGALALHTGFKTPIFTCIQDETETTESAFNTKEIEFVGLKVEKPANTIDEDVPPVKDEKLDSIVQTSVKDSNHTDHVDPISVKKESIKPKRTKSIKKKFGYRNARQRKRLIQNIWNGKNNKKFQ